MRLSVRLFARYREAAGVPVIEVDVPRGATLARIWEKVREQVPSLGEESRPLLACDRAYARPEHVVTGTEEIAAFPPVSGG